MGKLRMYALITVLFLPSLCGCTRFAVSLSPPLLDNITHSLFEECDVQLAREALPANLKILEGLLRSDPDNRQILTMLSMGFGGYALLFVESEDPLRASELYLRSREYGVRALGSKAGPLRNVQASHEEVHQGLDKMGREDLAALFWTTFSWNAWINLNLDNPAAIAQLGASEACVKKVVELDGSYFYGLPWIMEGVTFSARSPLFGGDLARARLGFQKALDLSGRKFFLAQYFYARYYAVATQDKDLFLSLTKEILQGDAQGLKAVCLINTMFQRKTKILEGQMNELFY